MRKSADDLLEGAIGILNRDGWYQGNLYEYHPTDLDDWVRLSDETFREQRRAAVQSAPVCVMGALHRASSGLANAVEIEDTDSFREAVNRLQGFIGRTIPEWNDSDDTSKEDVILALKGTLNDS